jgi:hypothetical protein
MTSPLRGEGLAGIACLGLAEAHSNQGKDYNGRCERQPHRLLHGKSP